MSKLYSQVILNIVSWHFEILPGSVAADLMRSIKFYYSFFCSSFVNAVVKELLKSVHVCQSYCKNKNVTLFCDSPCMCVCNAVFRRTQRSSIVGGTPNPVFIADPLEYVWFAVSCS